MSQLIDGHFFDESFWVAFCFVLFIVLVYKPIKKAIINSLDARIEEIKRNLEQAQKLKDDARIILEHIELEMQHFEDRKRRIIESAENSTNSLIKTKTKEIDLSINRTRDSATKSIQNMKTKATHDLKEEFTDHVMRLTRDYLEESKNNSVKDEDLLKYLLFQKG